MAFGVVLFAKDWKNGWPFLLAIGGIYFNGLLSVWFAQGDRKQHLTDQVGSIGKSLEFGLSFIFSLGMLILLLRVNTAKRS